MLLGAATACWLFLRCPVHDDRILSSGCYFTDLYSDKCSGLVVNAQWPGPVGKIRLAWAVHVMIHESRTGPEHTIVFPPLLRNLFSSGQKKLVL